MRYHLNASLVPMILFLLCWPGGSSAADGGTVTAVNRTVIPLQITDIQGRLLTDIAPARSEVIIATPGRHTFRAQRLDGSLYVEVTIAVKARGTVVWDILPTESVLEIRNRTTKDVLVAVDGQPLIEVTAGKTVRVDGIRPGSRQLTASSAGVPVASGVALFVRQDTYVWSLGQPDNRDVGIPVLRVRNFSGETVSIRVNGQQRIEVAPADSAALVGINPGDIQVEAVSLRTGKAVARETLTLVGGRTTLWEVAGREGKRAAVEVRNQTSRLVKVCVDGSFCLRITPKSSIRYDSLAVGRHTFQAFDLATGRLLDALEADLTTQAPYEWTVGTAD